MRRFFLALMLMISVNVFAGSSNISWVETTYQTKDIVGSWSALDETRTPCYTCKIKNKMYSFTAGAEVASSSLKKASRVHVLQVNVDEKKSVKVFKRKKTRDNTYVIQLGNEFFFFDEDTKCVLGCTAAFLVDTHELECCGKKHGFLISEGHLLVIYY